MTTFNLYPMFQSQRGWVAGTLANSQSISLSGASQQSNGGGSAITLAPACNAGFVRVKVLNGGSSDVTVAIVVQLSDGTGTLSIGSVPATPVSNVASSGVDLVFPFCVDIFPNALTVLTTLGGTTKTATMGVELYGGHVSP